MTQVGALQTAPILIAVVTSSLAMEGVKYLSSWRAARRRSPASTGPGVTHCLKTRRCPGGTDGKTSSCDGPAVLALFSGIGFTVSRAAAPGAT